MRYQVNYDLIRKRAKSVSSSYDKSDCKLYLERATAFESKNIYNKKLDINRFFSECACKTNANSYYHECLQMIVTENGSDETYADVLTERFVNEVLPYVSNLEYISFWLDRYSGLTTKQESMIESAVGAFKQADRISENHNKISKRFNIDQFVESARNRSLDRIVIRCCSMIDTYNIRPDEKMNICLDELSYLLQKNNIKYDSKDLVKYVTEYFLTRESKSSNNFDIFRHVLEENSTITDKDLRSVLYFTELYDECKSELLRRLNDFTAKEIKDINSDFGSIIRDMTLGVDIPRGDFRINLGIVLDYIKRNLLNDNYDVSEIVTILMTIPDNVEKQINDNWNYTRDELSTIIAHYEAAIENLQIELAELANNQNPDQELASKLIALKDCYIESVRRLSVVRDMLYTSYNIECMKEVSVLAESLNAMYLNEFKVFKFQNLIRATIEADNFIKTKGKKLVDKVAGKLRKVFKKKPLKEITIYEAITADQTIDICIERFDIVDESDFFEVHDVLTSICKEINETIFRNSSAKTYYIVSPGAVEIHVEDATPLIIEDADLAISEDTLAPNDVIGCVELNELAQTIDSFDLDYVNNLKEIIKESISSLNYERFVLLVEAAQYTSSISKDDIDDLGRLYFEVHTEDTFYKTSSIKNALSTWVQENAPAEIQLEAYNIIDSILESDDEKDKINKEKNKESKKVVLNTKDKKKDNDKKPDKIKDKSSDKNIKDDKKSVKKKDDNPLAGVNLNSLKLYIKGLKAKMKDMSNKEKEWSKNIDITFNQLYNACKNALISDRREAIIKGSIIPSFSKCIKIGLAVAGISFINPVAAAVTVIGGLALSKKLTKRERLLLLDEIDTELEVLESEIDKAKSSNNTNKYRALLRYQKDLQRQSQRIKYNVRIGKDLLPGSTTGLKNRD